MLKKDAAAAGSKNPNLIPLGEAKPVTAKPVNPTDKPEENPTGKPANPTGKPR